MFGKFHFQTKIILIQNLIILFVVITLGSFFYHKVMETIKKSNSEDFRAVSDSVADQIDNHLYIMDKTALQIAANPDIIRLFSNTGKDHKTNYFTREPFANAEIVRLLNSYNFKRDGFERICIYNDTQDFVYTATTPTTVSGIEKWFKSGRFQKLRCFFKKEGNYVYYEAPDKDIFNDTGMLEKPYFSVVRQMKNYTTNGQNCGYVEVQEFVRWIDDVAESAGDNTYTALLRGNHIIYKSPSLKKHKMDKKLKTAIADTNGLFQSEVPVEISGFSVYGREIKNTPYQVVFIREKSQELFFFNHYAQVIFMTIFLILLIAVVTEVLIIKKLSKPLEQLNESVGRVTLSHPMLEVEHWKNNNEFVRLQWAFNRMIEQMKEAMEREYASAANELKAQLIALQSQMNPHFLYNILAIISIEAMEYGDEKIPGMCTCLRRMLVYGSSIGDGYTHMKEEIDYAADYMELMKKRYEELFEYKIKVEDRLVKTSIPKYIIQPICENCFKHSFNNREPVWRINMAVFQKENKWMIEIHDNGIGFSQEYLEEFEAMKSELTLARVRDKLKDSKVGGLGISNIYMRLMICYENEFIFQLYNDAWGAVVLIGGSLND